MKILGAILLTLIAIIFIGVVMPLLVPLIVIGTSIWVLIDTSKRGIKAGEVSGIKGTSPAAWFAFCLLVWIIGFPLYLAIRAELEQVCSTARKKCPQCLGVVPDGARKCMHCGGDLAVQPMPAPAPVTPKPVPQSQAPEKTAADAQIPCPLCGQRLKISTLKQGENWCGFCFQKFVVE